MTKQTETTLDLPPPAHGGSFLRHPTGELEPQVAAPAPAAETPDTASAPEPPAAPAPVEPPQKGTRK